MIYLTNYVLGVLHMLTYSFEEKGKLTLYEYLYRCIKQDILEGKLKKDERLPSKRNLAKHLDVSVITVESAYAQLQIEGYIYSWEKKGYFVSEVEEPIWNHEAKNRITQIKQETDLREKSDRKKIESQTAQYKETVYFADFQTNNINSERFPFSIWSRLMREVLSEKDTVLLQSMPYNGVERLREAIAEYLYHFRGMEVYKEQVFIGAGTEYLYGLLIQLLGRDKVFAVEDPGYKKIAYIYASNGVKCEYISMDAEGMSMMQLGNSNAQVVHISPSHHFPTGVVMPIRRRQELLKWAYEKEERYIIEDDYDSEFRFLGKPIQTMQSIDRHEKVIYINTFSKSLAPSIRISYMILPMHLLEKFNREMSFYACTVSSFEQYTLANFMQRGYYEKHINRMKNFYKSQRNLVISAMKNSSLYYKMKIKEENAGLHFLLEVDTELSDEELLEKLRQENIRITSLSQYYHNQENSREHVLIINYSGIDAEKIPEVIKRLGKILEE